LFKLHLSLVDGSVPQQNRLSAEQRSSHDDVTDRNDDVDNDDDETSLILCGQARYLLCSVASDKIITII